MESHINKGDVEKAFAEADVIVENEYRYLRWIMLTWRPKAV